jgi:SAM-dependent methyltransferase
MLYQTMDHDYRRDHIRQFAELSEIATDRDAAMRSAPGGEFDVLGQVERDLLVQSGLQPSDFLVDVGCGTGRLASKLTDYLTGPYLGIDVVPEFVRYAAELCGRPDWRFEVGEGLSVPAQDGSANMVCAFSLFTHLKHEETYVYLQDVHRVLKPGGKVVFSFLEFGSPACLRMFDTALINVRRPSVLTQFMDRDFIRLCAARLGFEVIGMWYAEDPFIHTTAPAKWSDGGIFPPGPAMLGQSSCVMQKS